MAFFFFLRGKVKRSGRVVRKKSELSLKNVPRF